MAERRDEGSGGASKALYGVIAGVAIAVVALLLWTGRDASPPMEPSPERAAASSPEAMGDPAPEAMGDPAPEAMGDPARPAALRVPAPAVRIEDKGRLRVARDALRDGEVLALGLDLPDEVRGEGVRPVRIVDVTGRVLDVEAEPVDGSGTGLRVEIDPDWLEPGRYLIQVKTAGVTPLPVRRYVLEVTTGDTGEADRGDGS